MGEKSSVRPRKVPLRQCTGCGERKEKKELVRIIKTNEESLRELWDNVKCSNISIIGMPEGKERDKGTEKNV